MPGSTISWPLDWRKVTVEMSETEDKALNSAKLHALTQLSERLSMMVDIAKERYGPAYEIMILSAGVPVSNLSLTAQAVSDAIRLRDALAEALNEWDALSVNCDCPPDRRVARDRIDELRKLIAS